MCWTALANWCAHLKEKKEDKANDDEDEGHLTDRGLKSIALFADSFSQYTRTQLYTRECGLPRAVSLVGVSRCDCSTIATLSRSHGLHPSGPSSPSLPRPSLSTWPPSLYLFLSSSQSLSRLLISSLPAASLLFSPSRFLSRYNIPSTESSSHSWSGKVPFRNAPLAAILSR